MMLFGLLPWFCLMAAGLIASVVLLVWGVRSGQFADQERARYLPLVGEDITLPDKKLRYGKREAFVLAGFMAFTGIALAACFIVALLRHQGG